MGFPIKMAKNDSILVDGIVSQRAAERNPSDDKGEVFELLCFEQVLKEFDLSDEDIEAGSVDGRHDGGIDGFFILVNGHPVSESTVAWPKFHAQVDVIVISCKHHDTFKESTLNSMLSTVQELFNLSISEEDFKGVYSTKLIKYRRLMVKVYERLAITNPILKILFIYCSRGDAAEVGESVRARSEQIRTVAASFFSDADAKFSFMGAAELIDRYRRVKQFTLALPFQEHLAGPGGGYILIARLSDYYKMICDEQGNLRRYLFDSNVRDYLGDSKVNIDISDSLNDESGPDFLWLNNGITILATNAVISGGKNMLMQDIQVVNGLQTTESIYRHFHSGSSQSEDRNISIKIVVSRDDRLRDEIIRATNNQNIIEQSALHATDKIQRDIEQILERNNFYYERRRNYYRNIGRPLDRFVTPMYVASGFVAVILKHPAKAATLKSRFMRNQEVYEKIFSENCPIDLWPRLVDLLKASERQIANSGSKQGERALKNWRGLISLLYASKITGKFSFSMMDFCRSINVGDVDGELLGSCFEFLSEKRRQLGSQEPTPAFCGIVCREFGISHSLPGVESLAPNVYNFNGSRRQSAPPSDQFLAQVDELLPEQPWPTGVHIQVSEKLNVKRNKVQVAIEYLMRSGRRFRQIDGILYDRDGKII